MPWCGPSDGMLESTVVHEPSRVPGADVRAGGYEDELVMADDLATVTLG